jgi:hypothetical protein
MASGIAKCWGSNGAGQLGDGTVTDRAVPGDVVGLASGAAAISTSSQLHTCALTTGGGVKCWGSNYFAQLGDGTQDQRTTLSMFLGLESGAIAVAAGFDFSCAVTAAGRVMCWGTSAPLGLARSARVWSPRPPLHRRSRFRRFPNHFLTGSAVRDHRDGLVGPAVEFSTTTPWVCTVSASTVTLVEIRHVHDRGAAARQRRLQRGGGPAELPCFRPDRFLAHASRQHLDAPKRVIGHDTWRSAASRSAERLRKTVVIRGIGPSLASSGVTDPLPDPC